MKKHIFLILIMILLLSTIVTGCGNNTEEKLVIDKYEEEINELQKELSEKEGEISKLKVDIENNLKDENNLEDMNNLELDIHYLVEERDYYLKFIDSYLLNLSEDELIQISSDEWNYSLYIEYIEDDEKKVIVPENGIAELNTSSFSIVLVERQPMFPILRNYKDIFMKGSIDDYRSHIKLIDDNEVSWIEGGRDGTVVTSRTYEISNVKKGTTVEFELTDILKSRLKLNTNIIKVHIK